MRMVPGILQRHTKRVHPKGRRYDFPEFGLLDCEKQANYYSKEGNAFNQSSENQRASANVTSGFGLACDCAVGIATNSTNADSGTNDRKASTNGGNCVGRITCGFNQGVQHRSYLS